MAKMSARDMEGFGFFGKISASLSHELKNNLAVINEVGGLLSDLVEFSNNEKPVSNEKLLGLCAKVAKQVSLANATIKRLNSFSHSVDNFEASQPLQDILELFTGLTNRLLIIKGLKTRVEMPDGPLFVRASPFGILYLAFGCLEIMMNETEKGSTITLECVKRGDKIILGFYNESGNTLDGQGKGSLDQWAALVGARLAIPGEIRQVEIIWENEK